MRPKHPGCPRSRIASTRRRVVQGMGALFGSALSSCSNGAPPANSEGSGGAGMAGKSAGSGAAGAMHGAGTGGAGGVAPSGPMRKNAADRVMLGSTGIEISRLAHGTGTNGSNKSSDQTRLGVAGLAKLLTNAYSQGVTLFDTADSYGAHPAVAEAIRQVGRQNVAVLTKTTAQSAKGIEDALARFRTELGVDVIDIVLLHNRVSATWTTECEGAMEALELAKQRGDIRAHGVSCHTLEALELAAATPWVDVDLARINPARILMDSDPATVIGVLKRMKAAGKGVLGMKILGEGNLAHRLEEAVQHAVGLDCLDGFTIGFTSSAQLDEISQLIASA